MGWTRVCRLEVPSVPVYFCSHYYSQLNSKVRVSCSVYVFICYPSGESLAFYIEMMRSALKDKLI